MSPCVGMIVSTHRIRRATADLDFAGAVQADSVHDDGSALHDSLRALAILPNPYLRAQGGLFCCRPWYSALSQQQCRADRTAHAAAPTVASLRNSTREQSTRRPGKHKVRSYSR